MERKMTDDILCGVPEISEEIGFCERVTYRMLAKGEIPCWRTSTGRYETNRSALSQYYSQKQQPQ